MRKAIVNIKGSFIKVICALLCVMLLAIGTIKAQSPDKLFSIATDAYKAKNYQQSIEAYQKLLTEGYKNAAIYYNLGNAYYKTDQISPAILSYERALRVAPSDEDIRFNLKLANLKTVDKLTPVPQLYIVTKWENFVSSQSSKTWSIYSLCAVWLGVIFFAIYLFIDEIRRSAFFIGALFMFASLFFFGLAYTQSQAEFGASQAILTSSNTYMKSAPDASSTDLFMIHEGIKLNVLDKVGDWSKVRLADGKVGWVEQTTYAVI